MSTLKSVCNDLKSVIDRTIIDDEAISDYYFFTGIGVRHNSLHLGHHTLFKTLESLSQTQPVIFQVANDQKKFLGQKPLTDSQMLRLSEGVIETLKRYSWGKLFLVDNVIDRQILRPFAEKVNSKLPLKKLTDLFGQDLDLHRANYVGYQLAPICLAHILWPGKTPVIITVEDQLPFFLAMRDLAYRLGLPKPQVILIRPLQDKLLRGKMSSSVPQRAIFLNCLDSLKSAISNDNPEEDFCGQLLTRMACYSEDVCRKIPIVPGKSREYKSQIIEYLNSELSSQPRELKRVSDILAECNHFNKSAEALIKFSSK